MGPSEKPDHLPSSLLPIHALGTIPSSLGLIVVVRVWMWGEKHRLPPAHNGTFIGIRKGCSSVRQESCDNQYTKLWKIVIINIQIYDVYDLNCIPLGV